MADDRKSQSAAGGARGYKRSWKNLLINKRYQLRFTLFMVLLSAALMAGLGWWVMDVASEATEVKKDTMIGDDCTPIPALQPSASAAGAPGAAAPAGDDGADTDTATAVEPEDGEAGEGAGDDAADDPTDGEAAAPAAPGTVAPADKADADRPRRRSVTIDEPTLTITPMPPELATKFVDAVTAHYECRLRQMGALQDQEEGRRQILYVLIASCVLLTLGLAVYGIKMTHKVAGPLYKISLYMGKMRDGRFDKVYNLRKGDQLVEFYEHFKAAHAGVVAMEQADIDRLRAFVSAADAAGVAGKSPELDAALADARALLARKEKALE